MATKREALELQELELKVRKLTAEAGYAELSLAARQTADDQLRVVTVSDEINSMVARHAIGQLTELAALDGRLSIDLVITSPGGSIFDGLAIFDHVRWLRAQGTTIDTTALGWAASMAGILLQAGERRYIGGNSWLMIHEASTWLGRTSASAIRDEVGLLDRLEAQVLGIFAERSGRDEAWIKSQFERKNWWLSADQAVELGFADEVV